MFCHKCGNKSLDGAAFCHKCGTRLFNEENVDIPVTKTKESAEINVDAVVNLLTGGRGTGVQKFLSTIPTTEVPSGSNADDSENGAPDEIVSFLNWDLDYFSDLSNDIVIKAAKNGNLYAQMDMVRRCDALDDKTGARKWYMMALPERINIAKQGDFEDQISL